MYVCVQLDWLPSEADATSLAIHINDEVQNMSEASEGRIYGFGTIAAHDIQGSVKELERLSCMSGMRGVILGTKGLGKGLDDTRLEPLYETAEKHGLVLFIHPHYGVGNEHFGDYGHSLFLAFGKF